VASDVHSLGSARFANACSRFALSKLDLTMCVLPYNEIGEFVVSSLGVRLDKFGVARVPVNAVYGVAGL
jgi:hypothetical protein